MYVVVWSAQARGLIFTAAVKRQSCAQLSEVIVFALEPSSHPAHANTQVSELKSSCSALPALRDEQQQLVSAAAEADRLAALNSELRLQGLDLAGLQAEAARLGPLADEAAQLKQQLEEMREEAADLESVKVRD